MTGEERLELADLICSTTCADLADAVSRLDALALTAGELGDLATADRWRAMLADVWPRYAEACEFVIEWGAR